MPSQKIILMIQNVKKKCTLCLQILNPNLKANTRRLTENRLTSEDEIMKQLKEKQNLKKRRTVKKKEEKSVRNDEGTKKMLGISRKNRQERCAKVFLKVSLKKAGFE